MKCFSEKKPPVANSIATSNAAPGPPHASVPAAKAFTLVEVAAALVILSIASTSVFVVMTRCLKATADLTQRMRALEVATENMETLLASGSVSETTTYGTSSRYPDINWQTTVETFYEPITDRMWIRGICSAEYTDLADTTQTVELTHWLTDLTREQVLKIIEQQAEKQSRTQLFASLEDAAEYAGVDVETIEGWIANGMVMTKDGSLTPGMLDLFSDSDGTPDVEAIEQQAQEDTTLPESPTQGPDETGETPARVYVLCGHSFTDQDIRDGTIPISTIIQWLYGNCD